MTSTPLDQGPPRAGHRLPDSERSWTPDSCMLYALGVGAGAEDPTDELALTTENTQGAPLQVLPTFGLVLAALGPEALAGLGAAPQNVLLVDNTIEVRRPLPPTGAVRTTATVRGVEPHRSGDLVSVHTESVLVGDEEPLFTTRSTTLIRRDRPEPVGRPRPSTARTASDTSGAVAVTFTIPPNQGLLYRLSGGRNPLHSDPAVATAAGFRTPMLHGRCTLGFAARQVIREICGGDAAALRTIGARMRAPVWPGERLVMLIVPAPGARSGSFTVLRAAQDEVVLDRGVYECR